MAKQEKNQFFCTFKDEKIDFQTLIEKIFIEFIQEKENNNESPKVWYIRRFKKYNLIFLNFVK